MTIELKIHKNCIREIEEALEDVLDMGEYYLIPEESMHQIFIALADLERREKELIDSDSKS